MIIKICGMREPDNIRAVATLVRPDWMGFICWPGSKRFVAQVPAYLPQPPVQRVGVFVDAPVQYVRQQTEALGLHLIQLHGHEDEQYCHAIKEMLHLPIIKAFGISDLSDIVKVNAYARRSSADYLLFDTSTPLVGGSGRQFDWSLLSHYTGPLPFLLSGGIGPADATQIRAFSHPRCIGIDLNSRFEVSAALKDVHALQAFAEELRQ